MVAGGVQRESAPAGADFHHAIAGLEVEFVADAVELAGRCRLQRVARAGVGIPGPHRRRVHEVGRQEQREQLVAQVVVRGDVAPAAVAGVAPQPVPATHNPPAQPRRARLHAVEQVAVAHQQPDQPDQPVARRAAAVVALPPPLDEGFARADAAVGGHGAVEAQVADVDAHLQRAVIGLAQHRLAQRIDQGQPAATQGTHLRHQLPAQPPVQRPRRGDGGCGIVTDTFVHRDSRSFGWSCTGLPFIQRRSACQWMAPTTCIVISG